MIHKTLFIVYYHDKGKKNYSSYGSHEGYVHINFSFGAASRVNFTPRSQKKFSKCIKATMAQIAILVWKASWH